MGIFEDIKTKADELSELLDNILAMDTDQLYGANRLHEISFEQSGKESFKKIFSLLEDLKKSNLTRVPTNKLDPLISRLGIYESIFERARSLDLNDPSPSSTRDQIVKEVESNYQALYDNSWPLISFANKAGTDFKNLESEAKAFLSSAQESGEFAKKELEKVKTEASKILSDIKLVAAESGIEKTSFHFSSYEKQHKTEAGEWYDLGKKLLLGLAAFVLVFVGTFIFLKGLQPIILGYAEVGFLIITSLWTYAVTFCVKSFYSAKHNEKTNGNKAITLKTFRAFVDGADDEEVRDRMVQLAGAAAFTPTQTGYLKDENELPLPPIVESAKSIYSEVKSVPTGD